MLSLPPSYLCETGHLYKDFQMVSIILRFGSQHI